MRTAKSIACLLAIVTICGCGGSGNPDTVKVTGTVTYNGDTVDGATVAFTPASEGGHLATGITDASGKFSLTTFESDDGAVVGSYSVAITKSETTGGMSEDEEHAAINAGEEVTEATTTHLLPENYGNGATSGLKAEVTAGGPNDFTFELTD